ncbi:MAG TPA: CPBP family intramembrane metalloprotease [Planctomycetes bacterium]|nr:CPBP family intramembrane metalloprotease [Planctomycetota bacterium]
MDTSRFDSRPAPPVPRWGWWGVLIALALQIASSFTVNAVLFQSGMPSMRRLYHLTGGWIVPNLVANAGVLCVVVGFGLFFLLRLDLRGLSIRGRDVRPAAVGILLFWLTIQLIVVAARLRAGLEIALAEELRDPGIPAVIGEFLGQLFGNALVEEIFFRSFLFTALWALFSRSTTPRRAIWQAALLSQALFALMHLPNRVFVKDVGGMDLVVDQVRLFGMGLLFLACWRMSGNLLFVVGLHSLGNRPTMVVEGPGKPVWLGLFVTLMVGLGAWRWWKRRVGRGVVGGG